MHPRQRSPRGFYASDYRHLNRDTGFVRGHLNPKSFSQPPPPPPLPLPPSTSRRGGGGVATGGDVFVEAGRLATEYLVSQGVLPPNVLSLKWQNHGVGVGVGGFKKQGEIPVDGGGRPSALARLGSTVDVPSVRRKSGFDDFGQRGRRRGSFRSNSLDWGREFRRNGSWSDRYRGNLDIKDDGDGDGDVDDSVTRQQDEEQQQQQVGVDVGVGVGGAVVDDVGVGGDGVVDNVLQKPNSNETVPKSEDGNDLDAEADKDRVSGELVDSKENSSSEEKDTYNMEMEFVKSANDLENVSDEAKEVKDGTCDDDDDIEKSSISKNLSVQLSDQEDNTSSRVVTDLLSLCTSVKVPTKMRTPRTNKNLKADHHRNDGKENIQDIESLQGPEVLADNESVKEPSSGEMLSDKTYDLEPLDSDIAKVEPIHVAENTKESDTACNVEEVQTIGSQSGQDRGYMHDNSQESSVTVTLPEYGSCSSMAEERGEKRVAEDDDIREDTKRLREWIPALAPRTEEYFLHNNRIGMKESPGEDEISPIDKVTMTSDQGSLMSSSHFTQGGDKPFLQGSEEKQSMPSSFRTCDLNLIETSEVHENHIDHPILIYPPVTKTTKKAVPVDIDLSMSHASVSGKFTAHTTSGKEIEVIDLENDSIQEKSVDNMERKTDTMFQGLEGFSNHAQNTADIHDVQDGYGLMISELLGTDFPNCSSVPSDINSVVHNEMGLHNGTGPLAEDDSIYMSLGEMALGEIPLSFLRSWEQPPSQDYQKPF